jgi:uncharacterized protein YlxW (UPF0749 family)
VVEGQAQKDSQQEEELNNALAEVEALQSLRAENEKLKTQIADKEKATDQMGHKLQEISLEKNVL